MASMRAKVKVDKITSDMYGDRIEMTPVTVGKGEDNTYSKFTPSGQIWLMITNPDLMGKFRPGQFLYVDFTESPTI